MLLRKGLGLVVLVLAAGLVMGQKEKEKEKDTKPKEPATTKAVLKKIDAEKKTLTVTVDGKDTVLTVADESAIVGPRGGKSEGFKDDRLKVGAELRVVIEGKTKAAKVFLPFRKSEPKEKDTKEKDSKDKDTKPKEKDTKTKDKDSKAKEKDSK